MRKITIYKFMDVGYYYIHLKHVTCHEKIITEEICFFFSLSLFFSFMFVCVWLEVNYCQWILWQGFLLLLELAMRIHKKKKSDRDYHVWG